MSKTRLNLFDGCACTKPNVTPKNWKTGGKELLLKEWKIQYYFFDPTFKNDPKYCKGKQVRLKGMNGYHTLEERRIATKYLLELTIKDLKQHNYNPITNKFSKITADLNEDMYFIDALAYAYKEKKAAHNTLLNVKSMLKYVNTSIKALDFQFLEIKNVSRKHVKAIISHQEKTRDISNDRYNKYISMLSPLFDDLIELEIIEHNPIYKIKKYPRIHKLRKILSNDDYLRVYDYLKKGHYNFWRYMMIFSRSGSRSSELFRLKKNDVNIKTREFKILIIKGKQYKEVMKPINIHVVELWKEIMLEPGESVFSSNFKSGDKESNSRQVTDYWKRHVKDKIGITVDFYAFKHAYLDEVRQALTMQEAAKLAGHSDTRMMEKHYAIGEQRRELDLLKNLDIPFIKEKKEVKVLRIV